MANRSAEKEIQVVVTSPSDSKEKEVNAELLEVDEDISSIVWSEDKGGAGKKQQPWWPPAGCSDGSASQQPQITTLLFDVDDTLYPRSCGLGKVMSEALEKYVEEHVDLSAFPPLSELPPPFPTCIPLNQSRMEPPSSASTLQAKLREYYRRYGLTLNGLLAHHSVNEEEYLQAAHQPSTDLEPYLPHTHEVLKKQARFACILKSVSNPSASPPSTSTTTKDNHKPQHIIKWAFSNSIRAHIERLMKHLNIYDCFDGITDYYCLKKNNKPNEEAYRIVLAALGRPTLPQQCIFFDDSIANLVAAKKLGINTVLVGVDDPSVVRTLPPVDYAIVDIHHIDCALKYFGLSFKESDLDTSSDSSSLSTSTSLTPSSSTTALENNHTNHK